MFRKAPADVSFDHADEVAHKLDEHETGSLWFWRASYNLMSPANVI